MDKAHLKGRKKVRGKQTNTGAKSRVGVTSKKVRLEDNRKKVLKKSPQKKNVGGAKSRDKAASAKQVKSENDTKKLLNKSTQKKNVRGAKSRTGVATTKKVRSENNTKNVLNKSSQKKNLLLLGESQEPWVSMIPSMTPYKYQESIHQQMMLAEEEDNGKKVLKKSPQKKNIGGAKSRDKAANAKQVKSDNDTKNLFNKSTQKKSVGGGKSRTGVATAKKVRSENNTKNVLNKSSEKKSLLLLAESKESQVSKIPSMTPAEYQKSIYQQMMLAEEEDDHPHEEHGALFDALHVENKYRHDKIDIIIIEKDYHSGAKYIRRLEPHDGNTIDFLYINCQGHEFYQKRIPEPRLRVYHNKKTGKLRTIQRNTKTERWDRQKVEWKKPGKKNLYRHTTIDTFCNYP